MTTAMHDMSTPAPSDVPFNLWKSGDETHEILRQISIFVQCTAIVNI